MIDQEENRIFFLWVPFDNINKKSALEKITNTSKSEKFSYVVTPNVDHVVRLYRNNEISYVYKNAMLSLCDSKILFIASKILGGGIKQVFAGSDLTRILFEEVLHHENEITVIGAPKGVVRDVKKKFSIKNIHHYNPPMGFFRDEEEVNRCCEFVERYNSRYIFLAVGSPQQEILADKIKKRGSAHGVALCVGASLLFLADYEKRAPAWMSNLGFEWFYRMIQNPKKMVPRYFLNLKIFYIMAVYLFSKKN